MNRTDRTTTRSADLRFSFTIHSSLLPFRFLLVFLQPRGGSAWKREEEVSCGWVDGSWWTAEVESVCFAPADVMEISQRRKWLRADFTTFSMVALRNELLREVGELSTLKQVKQYKCRRKLNYGNWFCINLLLHILGQPAIFWDYYSIRLTLLFFKNMFACVWTYFRSTYPILIEAHQKRAFWMHQSLLQAKKTIPSNFFLTYVLIYRFDYSKFTCCSRCLSSRIVVVEDDLILLVCWLVFQKLLIWSINM